MGTVLPLVGTPRFCRLCTGPILRVKGEDARRFGSRRYCSRECALENARSRSRSPSRQDGMYRMVKAGQSNGQVPDSPYRVATTRELPLNCPTCGGLMKDIEAGAGRACRLCGRNVYAISALSRLEESTAGWV